MCLAVPGKILEIAPADSSLRMGRVSFGGSVREICLACVPEAAAGDYVIAHAGFAISVVDEAAAQRALAAWRDLESGGRTGGGAA